LKSNLDHIAKILRRDATDAEKLLWKHLCRKQLEGLKFRRQEPIGDYIVDFVCFERRIIIEIDGGQHAIKREKDIGRSRWLEGQGFKILRFWNNEVLKNIEGVIETIRNYCTSPSP